MADKLSQVILRYKIDDASLSKAQAGLSRLSANIDKLGTNVEASTALVKDLTDEVEGLGRVRAAVDVARQFYDMDESIGNAEKRAQLLIRALKEVGASEDNIALATAEFNRLAKAAEDFEANALEPLQKGGGKRGSGILGNIERTAGSLGLQPLGDVAGAADDLTELGEALTAMGVAVGPLTVAVAGASAVIGTLAIGFAAVTKVFRDGSRDLDAAIGRLETYYEVIADGTTESITAQIDAINKRKNLDSKFRNELIAAKLELQRKTGEPLTDVSKRLVELFGAQGLQTKIDELSGKVANADITIAGLNSALDSNEVAVNDAIAANERKLEADKAAYEEQQRQAEEAARIEKALRDKQLDQQADQIRKSIELDQQLDDLKAKGTSKDVAEEAQRINQLAISRAKELNALYELPAQTDATTRRIEELEAELQLLDYQSARLEGDIKQVVDARQAEIDAYEKLTKQVKEFTAGAQDAVNRVASLAKGVTDAVLRAGQERAKLEEKASEDVARINEQAAERRADLEKRYQDRLIDITEQAAESAAKALDKLKQSQIDLKRDVDRDTAAAARKQADDELQARVDFAREDEQAFRDHLTNLRRIREDAQDAEFEQALNRDFASLFFTRRDTSKQLTRANEDFNAERQQRQTELQQRLTDMRAQAAIEARERQIQYQQRLADLRTAYQRETAEIEANRQAQLAKTRVQYAADQAELSANLAKQLQARRAAYRTELDELNKALAAKVKAEFNAQSGIIQGASKVAGIISSIFSVFKTPVKRAGGGPLAAGVLAHVNEPNSSGRETFTTGGHTYGLPQNSLFMSPQAGYVNANKGSSGGRSLGNLSIPITVYESNNPTKTARMIDTRVNAILQDFFGDD